MFHIILYQPEIPPNTGNIMRLCANAGFYLHLIEPLGFSIDDKHLKRAGLDYVMPHPVQSYASFSDCASQFSSLYLCSTKGKVLYTEPRYTPGDAFLFGPETRGLPKAILDSYPKTHIIRIPMLNESRSLNLANAVSIITFEALRQNAFLNLQV